MRSRRLWSEIGAGADLSQIRNLEVMSGNIIIAVTSRHVRLVY